MASKKSPFAALSELRASLPDATKPVAAHAELEAAIMAAPDDEGAFLVYGDALQASGDPRGTLIALQHALSETPRSKKKKELLDAFMAEHRRYFLGSLESAVMPDGTEEVKLDWHLGFIRRAKVHAESTAHTIDLLTTLLSLPSAQFMRELHILEPHKFAGWTREAARVVAHVTSIARPKTLEELHVEKMAGWTPPPALYEAFPRLKKDAKTAWEAAMKRVAAEKRLMVPEIGEGTLPLLVPRSDLHDVVASLADVGSTTNLLRGLRAEMEKGRPLGLVEAMRAVFTAESLDAWALELVLMLRNNDQQRQGLESDWPIDLMGLFGGPLCVEWITENAPTLGHEAAVQTMGALRRMGTDLAICALRMLWANPSRLMPRRRAAANIIGSLARERDLRTEQLIDRVCSRPVDTRTSPRPPPGVTSIIVAARRAWLLDLMMTGRRLPIGEFEARIATRASSLPFATGLVFAHVFGESRFFRLDPDGTWRDVKGAEIKLSGSEKGSVGIPHPIEMGGEETISAWRSQLRAVGQPPPILQLDRPIYSLTKDEEQVGVLLRFASRRVGIQRLLRRFEEVDWQGDFEDRVAAVRRAFSKRFPRGDVTLTAHLSDERDAIASVRITGPHLPPLGELHPVVISELLYDLEEITRT